MIDWKKPKLADVLKAIDHARRKRMGIAVSPAWLFEVLRTRAGAAKLATGREWGGCEIGRLRLTARCAEIIDEWEDAFRPPRGTL